MAVFLRKKTEKSGLTTSKVWQIRTLPVGVSYVYCRPVICLRCIARCVIGGEERLEREKKKKGCKPMCELQPLKWFICNVNG